MRKKILLITGLVCSSLLCFALATTDQVARKGEKVQNRASWPLGAIEVINDPIRTDGWAHWFSGLPSDATFYELEATNTSEVNRLLRQLGKVHSPIRVELKPDENGAYIGFANKKGEKKNVPLVFALGDQTILDQWEDHKQLEKLGGAIRASSNNLVKALAPTLMIYVGNPIVELEKLQIPARAEVTAGIYPGYRNNHPDDPVLKRIDSLIQLREQELQTIQQFPLPELSPSVHSNVVKDLQQTRMRARTSSPTTHQQSIPQEHWGSHIKALKPLRVVNDNVNARIILAETKNLEAGYYINPTISSFRRFPYEFLEFRELNPQDGVLLDAIYCYRAGKDIFPAESK